MYRFMEGWEGNYVNFQRKKADFRRGENEIRLISGRRKGIKIITAQLYVKQKSKCETRKGGIREGKEEDFVEVFISVGMECWM